VAGQIERLCFARAAIYFSSRGQKGKEVLFSVFGPGGDGECFMRRTFEGPGIFLSRNRSAPGVMMQKRSKEREKKIEWFEYSV